MSEVREFIHEATVTRCVQEIESGLNVHRWLDLWKKNGREVDEAVAVGFYHQALQDARDALRDLLDR